MYESQNLHNDFTWNTKNKIREVEADVIVKERMRLEKEEVKILTGNIKELEQKNQDTSSQNKNIQVNLGQTMIKSSSKRQKFGDTKISKCNENDMMQAIYKSAMDKGIGKGFQIKKQDDLIDKTGTLDNGKSEVDIDV
ncbi:hypothetical protein RhiirA1_466669 [Rhizophagus irregularis]|uniref:Uncharacterized protein n=1 Tax=Rhizophagus irregularis TaxID=588596 RepID=A0A2N0RDG7_9GLOM|nr:hypothetical protein RhiirA1_466669 [Rhizophagus irregularis]